MPDESLLFDHLTGCEFMEFVGRMYGLPRADGARAGTRAAELFELDGDRKKLIAEYSKGMRNAWPWRPR